MKRSPIHRKTLMQRRAPDFGRDLPDGQDRRAAAARIAVQSAQRDTEFASQPGVVTMRLFLAVPAKPKTKRCAKAKGGCGERFLTTRPMQAACSPECAWSMAVQTREKAERAETREKRANLKTRGDWLKEAQVAFNAWIRLRDAAKPCISCGRYHSGQYHAGHFLSTGARPELRFHEANVHKQCAPCNAHLHGNLVLYRAALIRRLGIETVEWMEGPHEPRKYTAEALKAIRDDYRARAAAIRKTLEIATA